MLWFLLGLLGFAALLLIVAGDSGTVAGIDSHFVGSAVIGITMLLFVGGGALAAYRGRLGQAARDMMIWIGIALLLIVGYSYRDVFKAAAYRVSGDVLPPGTALSGPGDRAVRLRRHPDGHFIARMEMDGTTVPMLVDTGASSVVLKASDAKLVGIDIDRLDYSVPVRTANGTAFAAPIRIRRIAIGGIVIENVDGLVAKSGALNQSLLGMSFLTRLRSYEASGEFLTLRG